MSGRQLDIESRSVRIGQHVELRQRDDATTIIDGYAMLFDYPVEIAGGPEAGGWVEIITRKAVKKTLQERDDIRLLVNHDGIPIARTASGTMSVTADDIGLRVSAELDERSPLVQATLSAMRRGDLDQMSIGFRVIRDEWSEGYGRRVINELRLFDASLVTFPANEATVAQIRPAVSSGRSLKSAIADRVKAG